MYLFNHYHLSLSYDFCVVNAWTVFPIGHFLSLKGNRIGGTYSCVTVADLIGLTSYFIIFIAISFYLGFIPASLGKVPGRLSKIAMAICPSWFSKFCIEALRILKCFNYFCQYFNATILVNASFHEGSFPSYWKLDGVFSYGVPWDDWLLLQEELGWFFLPGYWDGDYFAVIDSFLCNLHPQLIINELSTLQSTLSWFLPQWLHLSPAAWIKFTIRLVVQSSTFLVSAASYAEIVINMSTSCIPAALCPPQSAIMYWC